jgi:hypothetical protein
MDNLKIILKTFVVLGITAILTPIFTITGLIALTLTLIVTTATSIMEASDQVVQTLFKWIKEDPVYIKMVPIQQG